MTSNTILTDDDYRYIYGYSPQENADSLISLCGIDEALARADKELQEAMDAADNYPALDFMVRNEKFWTETYEAIRDRQAGR
jgi:hypothetical protein